MAFTAHFIDSFDNYTDPAQKWATSANSLAGGAGRGSSFGLRTGSPTNTAGSVTSSTLTSVATRVVGFGVNMNISSSSAKTLVQIRNGARVHVYFVFIIF